MRGLWAFLLSLFTNEKVFTHCPYNWLNVDAATLVVCDMTVSCSDYDCCCSSRGWDVFFISLSLSTGSSPLKAECERYVWFWCWQLEERTGHHANFAQSTTTAWSLSHFTLYLEVDVWCYVTTMRLSCFLPSTFLFLHRERYPYFDKANTRDDMRAKNPFHAVSLVQHYYTGIVHNPWYSGSSFPEGRLNVRIVGKSSCKPTGTCAGSLGGFPLKDVRLNRRMNKWQRE